MDFLWIIFAVLHCSLYGLGVADNGWFWHITDFHYDFTYHERQLSCNSEVPNPGEYGDYWCDSPWRLVNNSVYAMAAIKPDVDFILWTGDTVLHGKDADLTYDINSDILDNVTTAIATAFPGKPVYATFGNHDYYPSNQFPPHNNELYNDSLVRWGNWIVEVAQQDSFRKGGYYTVKTPHGMRIVALNTNLYYTSNKQVVNETDPADQFHWLNKTLAQAHSNNEKVIVTAHIPPGVHTPNGLVWMWEQFNEALIEVLQTYASIIVGMHFGHDHADGFKIFTDANGVPTTPVFIAPSVTPWRYKIPHQIGPAHNPGVRLVKYNRVTGKHLDIEQYFLDLPKANNDGVAKWELEYRTSEVYRLTELTATSLKDLAHRMKYRSGSEFSSYWRFYTVSTAVSLLGECDEVCHAKIICGFMEYNMTVFKDCVKNFEPLYTSGSANVFTTFTTVFCWLVSCGYFFSTFTAV